MQVPTLNRTVEQNPTLLNTPTISNGIPGAFGEQVAGAEENLGKAGVQAGDALLRHIQWTNYQKAMDQVYAAHATLAQGLKDKLYSTQMQDVVNPVDPNADPRSYGKPMMNADGSVQQQPVGIINRKGFGATGSALEVKTAADSLVAQIKSSLPNNPMIQKTFDRYAATTVDSVYGTAVAHEATEWRKGSATLQNSTIANQISEASLAQTPELLSKSIDNVADVSNKYADFNELDDETRQKKINDGVFKTVQNAVLTNLKNTNSPESAHKLLDSVADKIPDELYSQLSNGIDDHHARIKAALQSQALQQKVSTRMDVFNQLIKGDTSSIDDPQKMKQLELQDPEGLGIALQKIKDSRGSTGWFGTGKATYGGYQPGGSGQTQEENTEFQKAAQNVASAGTQDEISKYILKSLSDNTKMSVEKLTILGDMAAMVGQGKKVSSTDPDVIATPQQNAKEAGIKALLNNSSNANFSISNMMANYTKDIKDGKSPQEAHSNAVQSEVNRTNPLSVKYKGDGTDPDITLPNGGLFHITGFTSTGSPKGKIVSSSKESQGAKYMKAMEQ